MEKETPCWKCRANCEKRKGVKQPKAKPSLKSQKKLVKKASESISHNVSKDSKQGSSQMLIDSGKNLPCRKLERQLKFRVLDRGSKKTQFVLCVVRKSQIKRVMMRSLMERVT